jgi:hypothetical protein
LHFFHASLVSSWVKGAKYSNPSEDIVYTETNEPKTDKDVLGWKMVRKWHRTSGLRLFGARNGTRRVPSTMI